MSHNPEFEFCVNRTDEYQDNPLFSLLPAGTFEKLVIPFPFVVVVHPIDSPYEALQDRILALFVEEVQAEEFQQAKASLRTGGITGLQGD